MTMTMPTDIRDQVALAYRRMATRARYRPMAPGDGMGHVDPDYDVNDGKLLTDEACRFADRWWQEEEDQRFDLGCPDYGMRTLMIYAIEAARACCSADLLHARRMLQMALDECERVGT